MAKRPAGPYTLEIDYFVNSLSHTLEVNCDALGDPDTGTAPLDVTMRSKDGSGVLLSGAANAFWDVVRPYFHTSVLASTYTLWRRNPNNNDKLFISGGTLTNPNGANGSTTPVLASQVVHTWRSAGGNILKLMLLEHSFASSDRQPIASSGTTAVQNLNTYVLSGDSFLMARDRSFPVAGMNVAFSQNEKVFERRYRA